MEINPFLDPDTFTPRHVVHDPESRDAVVGAVVIGVVPGRARGLRAWALARPRVER